MMMTQLQQADYHPLWVIQLRAVRGDTMPSQECPAGVRAVVVLVSGEGVQDRCEPVAWERSNGGRSKSEHAACGYVSSPEEKEAEHQKYSSLCV